MFDYHCHSSFSNDAEFPMEAMVQGALAAGLKEMAFTDHVDYEYADPSMHFDIAHDAYRAEISRLRALYSDRITLRHGLELGLQPHLAAEYSRLVAEQQPDFVLCSIHTCRQLDLYRGDFYRDRTPAQAWADYLEELLTIVDRFQAFNVVGHLDILRRYDAGAAAYPKAPLKEGFMTLFRQLAAVGKGLEVNTSGYRNPEEMPLPGWELLSWYKEAGGEILTLGSDAHSPDVLAYRFPETVERLKALGFRTVCTFEAMEPAFHLL